MPLYAYRCPDCGESFESLRPGSQRDDPLRCPACGSEGARRSMESYACAAPGTSASGAASAPPCGRSGFR
jgi:putative FmdB family regulatory protein